MKNVYVVIGHGSCGKSSLVRSLTGRSRYGKVRIQSVSPNEIIELWVRIRSAQEDGTSPQKVVERILDSKHDHYMITLRVESYNWQPKGIDYLKLLNDKSNINISKLIVIGETVDETEYSLIKQFCDHTNKLDKSWSTPINTVSTKVKKLWKWE